VVAEHRWEGSSTSWRRWIGREVFSTAHAAAAAVAGAGRVFDYLAASRLANSTYVMVMSDNGSQLFKEEDAQKQVGCIRCIMQTGCCADSAT
jgi:hypothetical protein